MQYPFPDGNIVDAVVFVKDKIIPIDSKFSLENYNRISETSDKTEKDRLEKGIVNLEKIIAGFKSRLKNKDFVSKAPKQIIDQQKETLAKKEAELQELKKHLSSLK